ncbi:aminoglycoside 6'-N-acetyltransferase [Catalinimonas niigatensis]|uniref:aminoglycoside 6'-N-acetyltransferase n=1 Tax=Catalinimonas niigatensis TaxID=1397264 RepID=UPI002666B179|nr:aminoglycoside 6'-N-acetyltransferase [Catalinimonas niigatensis]WPP53047.1 aminoglycoside 6'-N-acetyltransferase [Catalinimonas niigatensis]
MHIEPISEANLRILTELALALWPDCSFEEEYEYYKRMIGSNTEVCYLVKVQEDYVGLIQLSLRTEHVEGTTTSPVAYVEGIYVKPEYRKRGIGKQLITFGESWAKQKGCTEYASDVELPNTKSIAFHQKAGFEEVNRIVCFAKKLL